MLVGAAYADDADDIVGWSGPHDRDEPLGDCANGDETSFVSGIGFIELVEAIGLPDEDGLCVFEA